MSLVVQIATDSTHYHLTVEIRPGRDFKATIPKDVMPLELVAFLHRVRETIQRKWRHGDGLVDPDDDSGPARGHG